MMIASQGEIKMPKRFNDKQRSIFVKFHQDATKEEISSQLKSMGIMSGTRISSLINRWVLEVPFWKEEEYSDMLWENELVECVHENFDNRRRSRNDEAGE